MYLPSPSVATPLVVPSTITLAPASGCPSDDVTTPLSFPAVCEKANDITKEKTITFEIFLILLPPVYINQIFISVLGFRDKNKKI